MRWETVFCVASGPSLTAEDCQKLCGQRIIVVNTSFRLVPFADVLYAGDRQWWEVYGAEAKRAIGNCWTVNMHAAERHGLNLRPPVDFENSGLQAIELAISFGAKTVFLLGYDMQHTDGKRHWHDDHPSMENADTVAEWPSRFAELRSRFVQVRFVNCTRQTALTCFERMNLDKALELCAQGH